MGANVLLAYYHYCCKGHRPFALDWNAEESVSMAALDPYQVKYIQKTALHVQANGILSPTTPHASLTALQSPYTEIYGNHPRVTMSTTLSLNCSSRIGNHVVRTNDRSLPQVTEVWLRAFCSGCERFVCIGSDEGREEEEEDRWQLQGFCCGESRKGGRLSPGCGS